MPNANTPIATTINITIFSLRLNKWLIAWLLRLLGALCFDDIFLCLVAINRRNSKRYQTSS